MDNEKLVTGTTTALFNLISRQIVSDTKEEILEAVAYALVKEGFGAERINKLKGYMNERLKGDLKVGGVIEFKK